MNQNRRNFLKATGALTTGMLLSNSWGDAFASAPTKLKTFGLQLYTLREEMEMDPRATLAKVAEMGYKQIEGYEGKQGIFWGMTNKEYGAYLKSLGLTPLSSHCDVDNYLGMKAEDAAAIGMKYLICPWIGPQKKLEDYKWKARLFNEYGRICKQAGIRFAYHNHDYTFKEQSGKFPQDILMQETDPELVDFEMDIYWVVDAGQDPLEWLARYPKRFRLCHVKDRGLSKLEEGKHVSTPVGEGKIDFPSLLKTAKGLGMQYNIVEQEEYEESSPLQDAETSAAYMKKLSL
ncbi:TIM barrel protein [Olivibacter sitiensis]|uniref:TIM barrel protein n=1 Tax=Olivibacter sitiensis TaxID=376470 RepID=UPI0004858DC8|nr:TIM barrel protein [Olivibacter sitiensis]